MSAMERSGDTETRFRSLTQPRCIFLHNVFKEHPVGELHVRDAETEYQDLFVATRTSLCPRRLAAEHLLHPRRRGVRRRGFGVEDEDGRGSRNGDEETLWVLEHHDANAKKRSIKGQKQQLPTRRSQDILKEQRRRQGQCGQRTGRILQAKAVRRWPVMMLLNIRTMRPPKTS